MTKRLISLMNDEIAAVQDYSPQTGRADVIKFVGSMVADGMYNDVMSSNERQEAIRYLRGLK